MLAQWSSLRHAVQHPCYLQLAVCCNAGTGAMFVSWVTGDARVVDSLPENITRPHPESVVSPCMQTCCLPGLIG